MEEVLKLFSFKNLLRIDDVYDVIYYEELMLQILRKWKQPLM
jgi:hypothetical protein